MELLTKELFVGESAEAPAEETVPVGFADTVLAVLFSGGRPAALEDLAACFGVSQAAVRQTLELIQERLNLAGPIQLIEIQGGFQLSTKPEFAPAVAAFFKPEPQKLSRSMIETLAIVAYRQPVTASDIESVRGVQSDYSLRGLEERGLIQEVGRKKTPGRPILYGTTEQFLHHFKLKDLSQLPEIQAALPFSEPEDSEIQA